MPHSKHSKARNGHVHEDAHNNNNNINGNHVNRERMVNHFNNEVENGLARFQQCCVPTGCSMDPIDPQDPVDAVKVACNNESCKEGTWMHRDCFNEWEQSVLSFLRSCGRARSWSEKQRLQNLWTKKGYDLAYKACDCKCSRGHLRKDLDYFPSPMNDNAKKARKNKKKNDKPMPVVSSNHKTGHNQPAHHTGHQVDNHAHLDNALNKAWKKDTNATTTNDHGRRRGSENSVNSNNPRSLLTTSTPAINVVGTDLLPKHRTRHESSSHSDCSTEPEILDNRSVSLYSNSPPMHPSNGLRLRTNSMSSTGSVGSQVSSSGSMHSCAGSMSPLSSSPINGNIFFKGKRPDPFDPTHPSIFRRRQDLSAFGALPRSKQNPYNIHIEDVQEDEDARNFVLSNLTTRRMTALRCVLCKGHLPVYDRFPLVDGTMFLSPQAYDQFVVQVIWEGRIQFLNAVCLCCLEGRSEARCCFCKKQWNGSSLVMGTMYTYDIFAAMPCCQKRLTCKHCRRAVIDVSSNGLDFYSQYSRMVMCPYCKANDYHFIRSLQDTFTVKEDAVICCQ